MRDRRWRLVSAHALGLGLAGLFWVAFTQPFPLVEFCSRNRPTWVIPLFERPTYTAVRGHIFLLTLALASVAYLASLGLARGLRGSFAAWTLLAAVPLGFVFVLAPGYPLLSSDIFKYIFDGRIMAVYGENPFLRVPADYPDDRFYDLVYWKAVVNAHGPLWRGAEAAAAIVGGENCRAAVFAMKVWPIAAYLGTAATVFWLLRSWRPDAAIPGTMAYAWNPVVVLEAIQNGHNDVVAALPALAAVASAAGGRFLLAFPLLAVAALIKPLALALGPLLLVAAWRRRTTEDEGPRTEKSARRSAVGGRRSAIVGIAAAGAMVLVAYAPFWAGPQTLQGLERGGLFSTSPAKALLESLEGIGVPFDRALNLATGIATVAFLTLLLPLLLAVSRGRMALVPAAGGVFFLYLLIAAQWFNPWYMLWLVPFAALAATGPPLALGLAFSLLSPIVYALRDTWPVVLVVFLPIALLAIRWHRWLGWPLALERVTPSGAGSAVRAGPAVWRPVGGDEGRP